MLYIWPCIFGVEKSEATKNIIYNGIMCCCQTKQTHIKINKTFFFSRFMFHRVVYTKISVNYSVKQIHAVNKMVAFRCISIVNTIAVYNTATSFAYRCALPEK